METKNFRVWIKIYIGLHNIPHKNLGAKIFLCKIAIEIFSNCYLPFKINADGNHLHLFFVICRLNLCSYKAQAHRER